MPFQTKQIAIITIQDKKFRLIRSGNFENWQKETIKLKESWDAISKEIKRGINSE